MAELKSLADAVVAFRDQRDWKQFHNAKDVSISLLLEASELLELFQWKREDELTGVVRDKQERIAEELADVFYYTLLIAHDLNIDLATALRDKLKVNAQKYPTDKVKGSSKKYTEL